MSMIECPACKNRSIEYDPRCRSFICVMDDCRSAWSPEPGNKAELTALRNQMRPLMDKAELADMYEKWLLDIGRVVGCQHLDEQLPNCVIAAFHGYRDADELESQRYEARWIRAKLDLPEDCELLSGETSLAGTMHVLCSDAYGFREYIKSHKCDDKQGEIARLAAANKSLSDVLRAFLARYHNKMVNADLLFSDIAELARTALEVEHVDVV